MTNNSVAPGERMALAAFRHHRAIDRRAHALLDPNLARVRTFFAREPRLAGVHPGGRQRRLSAAAGARSTATGWPAASLRRYSTLVVPGRFFEAPRHIRISFGCAPALLARGLANISRALDDLVPGRTHRSAPTHT